MDHRRAPPRGPFGLKIPTGLRNVLIMLLMGLKRLMFFLFIGFAIFFIIQQPAEAAKVVRATGENASDWFGTAAGAFSKFIRSLF